MARFEKPLVLRVFGYVEPGTAAAAALGTRQPFAFHRGACPSFGPSRSHGFGPGCRRTLLVLVFFGGGGEFSIKNCETIPAQDSLGRSCFFGRETLQVRVLLLAPFPLCTSGRRAF